MKKKSGPALIASLIACITISAHAAVAADAQWSTVFNNGQQALADQKLELAEEKFRKALSLVRSQSKDSADTTKCMRQLANVLALRNKTGEAQQLFQKVLANLTKQYGADSKETASTLMALGSLQEAAGDHNAAMTFYQRALAINEKSFGPYSPAVANNLHGLARATCAAGNKVEGDKHYKRAMQILSQDPSLDASKELQSLMTDYNKDLITGEDNSNRDLLRDFKKDILQQTPPATPVPGATAPSSSSSSAWQQQAISTARSSRDWQTDDSEKVALRGFARPLTDAALAPAYKVMNETLFTEAHYGKGEDQYQRMIAVDINALGPNHPSVANDLTGLAQLYIKQQRNAEAIPLLERALGIYDQVYGPSNPLSASTCVSLASAQFRTGNAERAATLYRRALTQTQSLGQPNSTETARILNELAYLYFTQGKLQDAVTFYQWALASTEGAFGKEDSATAACLKDYAQVLRSLGRTDDATKYDARASEILASGGRPGKN
jgi:tetratricopeptide (TPR) repeat protein